MPAINQNITLADGSVAPYHVVPSVKIDNNEQMVGVDIASYISQNTFSGGSTYARFKEYSLTFAQLGLATNTLPTYPQIFTYLFTLPEWQGATLAA